MAVLASVMVWARSRGLRRVVVHADAYSTTISLLRRLGSLLGFEVDIVEPGWENIAAAVRSETLILVETVSNTMLRVYNVEEIARDVNSSGSIIVVDNTIASPVNYNPVEHGVRVTVYSCTKHVAGHNDVLAEAVVTSGKGDAD